MKMDTAYTEIDISEEFERLWDTALLGPDAAAQPSEALRYHLGVPLAPRPLHAEAFRAWLLP